MPSDFIVDVTEHNFEYEVLSYSENTPVVVEFWATWCQPCKYLGPILEQLAAEAGGEFRLARVDVDANHNLALRFGVRSVPTVKAVSQGQVVGEFAGAQPEARVREFLSRLAPPSESALAKEKADSLLLEHRWDEAEQIYRELDEQAQSQPGVLLGLAKSLLAQGKSGEALFILNYFPASREYQAAETLRPLAESMMKYEKGQLPDETDLDAMFRRSIHLAVSGNHPAALDGLLEIIRQDKRYRGDLARQVFLAVLDLLGPEDPDSRQYRAELTSLLF